eukprot:4419343-Pyramimonas_sp.AAC.3
MLDQRMVVALPLRAPHVVLQAVQIEFLGEDGPDGNREVVNVREQCAEVGVGAQGWIVVGDLAAPLSHYGFPHGRGLHAVPGILLVRLPPPLDASPRLRALSLAVRHAGVLVEMHDGKERGSPREWIRRGVRLVAVATKPASQASSVAAVRRPDVVQELFVHCSARW